MGNISKLFKVEHSIAANLLDAAYICKKSVVRASLVAQWLRICLPMQGTRIRGLVQEDTTCRGATKPVHHNY